MVFRAAESDFSSNAAAVMARRRCGPIRQVGGEDLGNVLSMYGNQPTVPK